MSVLAAVRVTAVKILRDQMRHRLADDCVNIFGSFVPWPFRNDHAAAKFGVEYGWSFKGEVKG